MVHDNNSASHRNYSDPDNAYAMADRYHYLPSIGIAIGLAWGIPFLIKSEVLRKRILFPVAIVYPYHHVSFNMETMRLLERQYHHP